MRIGFLISRPIRNATALRNLDQRAKDWLASLIQASGDQLAGGGDGQIGLEIDGFRFEFSVLEVPGVFATRRVRVRSGNAANRGRRA